MHHISELTQKGDPILRVELPAIMIRMLKESARKNKRRPQDEFIKRMAMTLKNEAALEVVLKKLLPDLQSIYNQA